MTAAPMSGGDGLFDNFTWDHGAALLAAALAAFIAAGVAVTGYVMQQRASRRDQRAVLYAEALRAVEDYREAPYRVRRRDGSHDARRAITDHISDVQSRISFHSGWLRLNAPAPVAEAYDTYVAAARAEAGAQMTDAWAQPATVRDEDVPLGTGFEQPRAKAARQVVLGTMATSL